MKGSKSLEEFAAEITSGLTEQQGSLLDYY